MKRRIINIDENKCSGCGICAAACHEGAIEIIDGKAKLVREDFCDGLGDCLPSCPAGAITFEEREAPAYDGSAVKAAKDPSAAGNPNGVCPGTRVMAFERKPQEQTDYYEKICAPVSHLNQWPCQIKLMPTKAGFYDGAGLLIAADCTAFAYAGMHEHLMKDRITVIGCPKLDAVDYTEKLTAIIRDNDIKSVVIARMEVPCCGGLQWAAENALKASGKLIPWQVVTFSTDGQLLDQGG